MLRKALIWDRGTARVKLWVVDVPTDVTREELIALVTLSGIKLLWKDWRNHRIEFLDQDQTDSRLVRQRAMTVDFQELVDSATVQ